MTDHYNRETLIDYLHRALEPAADARVFAHLDRCAPCRALCDEEAAVGEALRAAARADERELPALVKARVWDAIRRDRPTLIERLRSSWAAAIAVPIAAVLALAAYFSTPMIRGPVAPPATVSAAFYLDEHNAAVQQNPLGPGSAPAVYATDAQGTSGAQAATYIDTADAASLDADGAHL